MQHAEPALFVGHLNIYSARPLNCRYSRDWLLSQQHNHTAEPAGLERIEELRPGEVPKLDVQIWQLLNISTLDVLLRNSDSCALWPMTTIKSDC